MINELYSMSQSLKQNGLIQTIAHRDIGRAAGNPGLIVEINAGGLPVSIEYCSKPEFNHLFTHRKGNHNSFPIICIHKPLLVTPAHVHMSRGKNALQSLSWENINPQSKDIVIEAWTLEQLLPLCEQNEDLASLNELIKRFPKNQQDTIRFNKALVELIQGCADMMPKPLGGLVQDILIGTLDKKKGTSISKTQIVFDIDDADRFSYNVRDPRLWELLIQKLSERDKSDSQDETPGLCQLTGKNQVLQKSKYPNPNLKAVGQTYLYIKNAGTACLTRYGMKGLDAYLAGKATVNDIENALAFLTGDDREHITWSRIPGSSTKQVNLLLAYVVQAPAGNEKIAKMMGNATPHEQEEARFETLAEQVCGRLKEYKEINTTAVIHVIVINKVDDGRKQVLLSQSYMSEDIITGTDRWQAASKESPPISYKFKEKGTWKTVAPHCPYPGEIIHITGKVWRTGKQNNTGRLTTAQIPSLTLKEVYDVFIPTTDEKPRCRNIIKRILGNFQALMLYMGHCDNRQEISISNKTAIYDTCLAASLLSILLFKLGFRREDIMHSTGYQIGQVMKLADILHREYCQYIRNNSLPSQLIGNSLMATALEMPNKALAMLAERIRIYVAWVDTEKDKDIRFAQGAQKQLGIICAELGTMDIPEEFDDVQRAQVLLGYLARIENVEAE